MTNKDWEHHERTKAAKEEDIYPQRTQRTQKKVGAGLKPAPTWSIELLISFVLFAPSW
jgi:hypothetical protein